MEDRRQELLDEVIRSDIRTLKEVPVGTKERTELVGELTELYRLRIEDAKIEAAEADKYEEKEMRHLQLKSQAFDRWINIGVQVGLGLATLVAYDVWYRRGLKFEETGTITSPMTRNLISRLLPRK